jgi:FkbM family methyltransferase
LALLHIFEGKRSGTFIDVGAHHPYRLSVTHHLSRLGWHGVNVDANKDLIGLFDKERKRDINICAAVGTADKYSFTIFKESALSSVNVDWKNNFASQGWEVDRVEEVPGLSLKRIYAENFPMECIDLLSIDAEGSDYDVLRSIEFDNLEKEKFPKFLLLEATPPVISALNTDSVQYAINFGYVPTLVLPMSVLLKRG